VDCKKKVEDLVSSILPYLPHVICLTERHLKQFELDQISLHGYRLTTSYCRRSREKGGICIFAHKYLYCLKLDLSGFCKDQDIEVCALKLELTMYAYILAVYRAPSSNLSLFLNGLDNIINSLFKPESKFIIYGDFNIDYSTDNEKRGNSRQFYRLIICHP
jgi:exonuclease III